MTILDYSPLSKNLFSLLKIFYKNFLNQLSIPCPLQTAPITEKKSALTSFHPKNHSSFLFFHPSHGKIASLSTFVLLKSNIIAHILEEWKVFGKKKKSIILNTND